MSAPSPINPVSTWTLILEAKRTPSKRSSSLSANTKLFSPTIGRHSASPPPLSPANPLARRWRRVIDRHQRVLLRDPAKALAALGAVENLLAWIEGGGL
jgi:hypothetical protein